MLPILGEPMNDLGEEGLEQSLHHGVGIRAQTQHHGKGAPKELGHRTFPLELLGLLGGFTDHEDEEGVENFSGRHADSSVASRLNQVKDNRQ